MKRATGNGMQILEAMPGAREVLQAVNEHPCYASALLTGNIEPAAQLKVEITGLAEFFQLPGAFGNESFDRRDLPAIAAQRINEQLGEKFEPEQFIVIGDTPTTSPVPGTSARAWWRSLPAVFILRRTARAQSRRVAAGFAGC